MPKQSISLLATGTGLIVASGVALAWLRPRTVAHEVPTLIGLFGPGMTIEELVSLTVSLATPVLLVLGLRFRNLSLLPLLPAVGVGAILAWDLTTYLAVHGPLPLPLWVVNLSSRATVIGLAAISSGICSLLATRLQTLSRAASAG